MEAECTGCGGRVMPYRQYVFHFGPRAVCSTCGQRVRLRHFGRVVAGFAMVVGLLAFLLTMSASPVLLLAAFALIVLSCLMADFWTYRNLPWDPVEPGTGGGD